VVVGGWRTEPEGYGKPAREEGADGGEAGADYNDRDFDEAPD